MTQLTASFILALVLSLTAFAQNSNDKKLDQAIKNGKPLPTQITVSGNVTAQAVLIPRVDARRIFGNEIANNYAVIEINVGNKSPDAALIIHGIFIDYTHWALSGTPGTGAGIDGLTRDTSIPFQASTNPNQVASEEYRVVRGQLLDAQMWTSRNWTMRLLTLAGHIASAYAFSINEEGIVRGLNAFSGSVVPGLKEAWPDGTIEQLNRVSDFGFQTNKVIPKQGGEVIVCFFPIDRFLTPGFKKLFLKSPALFFAPNSLLVDKSLESNAAEIIGTIKPSLNLQKVREALPCYLQVVNRMKFDETRNQQKLSGQLNALTDEICWSSFGLVLSNDNKGNQLLRIKKTASVDRLTGATIEVADPDSLDRFARFLALDFISQMSLNTVTITVDGVMTVDTTTIPGKIDATDFDALDCGNEHTACFWADPEQADGVRTGTIHGSYLTGGAVSIAEKDKLGITDVKVLSDESSDQKLRFSFKLTKGIPSQTLLHFTISKPAPGSATTTKTIDGVPRDYSVTYDDLDVPRVTGLKQEGNKLTVTGTQFFDMPPDFPIKVKVHGPDGSEVTVKPDSIRANEIKLTIPGDASPAGCWFVVVYRKEVAETRPKDECHCFIVEPGSPTLESAKRDGDTILVEGTNLIDTRLCNGKAITFQLTKEGSKALVIKRWAQLEPQGEHARLELPAAAKDGKWKLEVLIDGVKVDTPAVDLE